MRSPYIDPTSFLPRLIEDIKDTSIPLKVIAARYGVSYGWVWQFIKKNNLKSIKRVKGKGPIKPEQVNLIVELKTKGHTSKEIASKAGVALATVTRYLHLKGLTKPYKKKKPDAVVITHPGKDLLSVPCNRATHTAIRNAAGFFEMPVQDFVAEAVAHYIKHLKA